MLEEIFCPVDNLCSDVLHKFNRFLLGSGQKKRNRKAALYVSEIMISLILLRYSNH